MSINKAMITGNLTRDAELRQSQGGTEVLRFSVAVNDRRRNPQTGEWSDYANYIDCVMFGSRAGKLAAYLAKGTKVAVEGKLRWSQWERDGQKRSKVEVLAEEVELMSRQDAPGRAQDGSGGGYGYPHAGAPQRAPQTSMYDEDMPF